MYKYWHIVILWVADDQAVPSSWSGDTYSMHYIATSENVVVEVADLMRAGDGFKFNS